MTVAEWQAMSHEDQFFLSDAAESLRARDKLDLIEAITVCIQKDDEGAAKQYLRDLINSALPDDSEERVVRLANLTRRSI